MVESVHETGHHRDSTARNTGEQREDLRTADGEGTRGGEPFELLEPDMTSGVATESLADQQDDAVDSEEDGRGERLGEEHAQFVLEQQTRDPNRYGRDGEHEQQSIVRIGLGLIQMPE